MMFKPLAKRKRMLTRLPFLWPTILRPATSKDFSLEYRCLIKGNGHEIIENVLQLTLVLVMPGSHQTIRFLRLNLRLAIFGGVMPHLCYLFKKLKRIPLSV